MATRRAAENRHEYALGHLGDLPDGRDSETPQSLGGDRTDTPESLDRERMEKLELAFGRYHEQAVRLRNAARHLREELRPRDADGDRQADALANVAPQPGSDLARTAGQPPQAAHVEERLVDRQSFDQRCRVLEHPIDRLARLGIRRHARRDDYGARAESPRHPSTHGGADPTRLCLIARSE